LLIDELLLRSFFGGCFGEFFVFGFKAKLG